MDARRQQPLAVAGVDREGETVHACGGQGRKGMADIHMRALDADTHTHTNMEEVEKGGKWKVRKIRNQENKIKSPKKNKM